LLLNSFLKGNFEDKERAEMSLIASSQFLASPVGRELTSNVGASPIGSKQTLAWWYAKL